MHMEFTPRNLAAIEPEGVVLEEIKIGDCKCCDFGAPSCF
jgi:hypothetical protein